MEYYLLKKGTKLTFEKEDYKYECLGEGTEGDVYLIDGQATKFYREDCNKRKLNKETAEYLSNIDTQRILMLSDILLDGQEKIHMEGTQTKYIEDLGIQSFLNMETSALKEELKILSNDLKTLGDAGVALHDLQLCNVSFNNGMYFFDPGRYQIMGRNTFDENIQRMNQYILYQLLQIPAQFLIKDFNIGLFIYHVLADFHKSGCCNMLEYLGEIQEDNLKEFILKKA